MLEFIVFILLIIALVLIVRFARKALTVIFTVSTVLGVVLIILGFFILQDAMSFKDEFSEGTSAFVLADGNEYLTSIVIDMGAEGGIGLQEYEHLDSLDEGVPEEYYKAFIINRTALEDQDLDNITFLGERMNSEEAVEVMYSENPEESLAEFISEKKGIPESFAIEQIRDSFDDGEQVRQTLFAQYLISFFGNEAIEVIGQVKKGNIIIRPNSLMFQAVKYIPMGVFEAIA